MIIPLMSIQSTTLSLIIPIYNEEAVIPELHKRLQEFISPCTGKAGCFGYSQGENPDSPPDTPHRENSSQNGETMTWEVVFVNDGSRDNSLALLKELASKDKRYKVLSFSRNFGHQFAITAGMDRASGEAIVVMDADLQDPPEVVQQMITKWREGYDIVYAIRRKREGESFFKKITAALFYRLFRSMIGISIPLDAGDFRLMSRAAVRNLCELRENNRFIRGMVAWVGFKQTSIEYDRAARFAGETKYPLRKMIKFAVDGITSFSTLPLRFATWMGIFSGFVAIGAVFWVIYEKLYASGVVPGWATIMIAVSLGSSAQLIMTGILGEYIGRIFEEVKRRPLYIISEEINFK